MIKKTIMIFLSLILASLLNGCASKEPSSDIKQYNISFYDEGSLYQVQTVDEGEVAIEPEKPTKVEKEFLYWCCDAGLTDKYDFKTPVTSDISLYSLYKRLEPFSDYSGEYNPVNSPLVSEQHFVEGDKNVDILLKADGVEMNSKIEKEQVLLTGGFEDLSVVDVNVDGENVVIKTSGVIKKQTSYAVFSKGTNKKGIYLTVPFEINERLIPSVSIDKSSVFVAPKEKDIFFSVKAQYQTLKHDDGLTPEEYLANINNGTYNYFSITEGQNVSLTIRSIHDDFSGFNAQLHYDGDSEFNDEVIDSVSQNIKLLISKEAFMDAKDHELSFELNVPSSYSHILVTPVKANTFSGNYHIHLVGCKFRNDLASHIEQLTTSPNNKKLFISIPDAVVTIESIFIASNYEIYGRLKIETENAVKNASISLKDITINEEVIKLVSKQFNDEDISIEAENVSVEVGYDSSLTGTIHQDDGASYKGIKSYIQDLALNDENNTINELIFIGTTLGKIAYGAYSGNYTMVGEAVGKAFGIDSIRDPALLMLDNLQSVMDKLTEIENGIQALGDKIDSIKKELENIGQQEYLNTFLNAYSIWDKFKSDYYAPIVDEIRNYTSAYYRYYYDFAMASHPDSSGKTASIEIYFDENGEVVFPADNFIYSVDGKIIDKSKTKTVVFPELEHTLAGIRHEGGHSYRSIENDVIADLVSYASYSDEEIAEILKTLTFNAMKSYFSSQSAIDGFTNKFEDFCQALTASDIISSINISPLTCLSIMLQTIFNFGFEIEPDFNLVAVKLQTVFYSAKKIFDFVKVINSGDVNIESYDELIEKVDTELSSDRFYRSNDENGNVYSYVCNTYVNAATNAYAIQFGIDYYKNITAKLVENDFKNINAPKLEEFESVSEEDIAFMKIKVKIYNIIKGTNYSFKSYLGKIGIIPKDIYDKTLGVLTKIDGIVAGEDTYDLTVPHLLDVVYFASPDSEPTYVEERKYDMKEFDRVIAAYVYAIKGEMIYFDDDETYQMVAGFGSTDMKDAEGYYKEEPIAFFGSDVNISYFWDDFKSSVTMWSYYVTFQPVH